MVDNGGFLKLDNISDEIFFRSYDQALKNVKQGDTDSNHELRYQLTPVLYNYIDLLIPSY